MRHGKERLWALVMAFVLLLSNFALAEGEMATSPDLSDEPVLTCEHVFERKTDPAAEREAFEPINAWMHKYSAFIPVWEECGKCGLRRNQSEELSRTENVPHIFINGVCEQCGQANLCTHEKKTAVYDPDGPVEYTPLDEQSHTLRYDATPRYRCMTCREEWYDAAAPAQHVEETAAHNFSDSGQCICGHTTQAQQEPCKHENRGEFSMMDGSVAFVDATGHSITGRRLWFEACEDCGLILSETPVRIEENVTEKGPHLFYLGLYCEVCGYIPDPEDVPAYECDHMETYERTLTGDNGYTADDANHTPASYVIVQTVCANDICGEVIEEKGTYTPLENALPEPHAFEDGVCAVCGHACSHPNISNEESYSVYEIVPFDAGAHTTNVYNVTSGVCENCGLFVSDQKTLADTFQTAHTYDENGACTACGYKHEHVFENGVCAGCGAECGHESEPLRHFVREEMKYSYYTAWADHMDCYATWQLTCADCGADLGTVEELEFEDLSAHVFVDGVCQNCGCENVCPHDMKTLRYDEPDAGDIAYEAVDGKTHTLSYEVRPYYYCARCATAWQDETLPVQRVVEEREHVWREEYFSWEEDGAVCVECGYDRGYTPSTCAHEHMTAYYEWRDRTVEKDVNGHKITGYRVGYPQCADCGEIWWDQPAGVDTEPYTETSAHVYDEVHGALYCPECGFTLNLATAGPEEGLPACVNAETYSREVWTDAVRAENAQTHISGWLCARQEVCAACCVVLSEETEFVPDASAQSEPHTYANGVCTACGAEEPDEPTQPGETDEPTQPGETDEPTQPGETDEPAQPDETDEPTQPGETDEPDQPTPTPSAPVATPTPIPRPTATTPATVRPTMPVVSDIPIEQTPAPTPAPVYTQVPVTETVHGVKAEDNVPMAEALATVADNIAAAGEAEGVAAGIEIVNAEKIVTAAEKAALDALPVREQILTFLSVIGFEEQVNRALETAGEILSEPALALKAQIQERIAAMSEQEYAAFEAVLLENFPQEAIEIDGEEYIFFIIELEVRVGDSVRIERYGFRREGDEWIFAQLEIAG